MISIHNSMTELERCTRERNQALECYISALQNMAHYAIELDDRITAPHRHYISALAADVSARRAGALAEAPATMRGLLRDYRDKAAQYLSGLRDELARTAGALQQIMEAVAQSDCDHEQQMRVSVRSLRSIADSPRGGPVAQALNATASAIENSLEQLQKQHQCTIAQFLTEIRMLHKRIDALEAAASIDGLTKLLNRGQMEDRVRSLSGGPFALLLIGAAGLRQAETTFSRDVAIELSGAVVKRLRNALPPKTPIGRWSDEGFVVALRMPKPDAIAGARVIAEQIGGPYACILNGKAVRPSLQIRMGVVEHDSAHVDRVIQQVSEFLGS